MCSFLHLADCLTVPARDGDKYERLKHMFKYTQRHGRVAGISVYLVARLLFVLRRFCKANRSDR